MRTRPALTGVAAALLLVAAALGLVAIPVSLTDPIMAFRSAGIALAVGAAVNATLAGLIVVGRARRAALIALGVVALLLGLIIIDGAVAASTHPGASLLVAIPFWGVVLADVLGGISAMVAAALPAKRPSLG